MHKMMVDIETLSLRPNAYIIAIGVVIFTANEIVEKVHLIPRVRTPFNEDIDPSTVEWWLKQADRARENVIGGERDIKQILGIVNNTYRAYDCKEIWANGPQFDICAIENAMRNNDMTPAWKYYEVRDVRTELRDTGIRFNNNHVAVDDAENQALALIEFWNQ